MKGSRVTDVGLSGESLRWAAQRAARAPSGFNRQPWELWQGQGRLVVRERSGGPPCALDPQGLYAAVDIGGFVEHFVRAARSRGAAYEVTWVSDARPFEVTLIPSGHDAQNPPEPPARLEELFQRRRTDRGAYRREPVDAGSLARALGARPSEAVEAHAVTDPRVRASVARALGFFEGLTLRCAFRRRTVLEHLGGNARNGEGIPLGSLGLNPVQRTAFRVLAAAGPASALWRWAGAVHARSSRARIARTPCLVSLSVLPGRGLRGYFELGRVLSALWLTLADGGLACCPITSFVHPGCADGCSQRPCRAGPDPSWWEAHFPRKPAILLRVGGPRRATPPSPRLPSAAFLFREEE